MRGNEQICQALVCVLYRMRVCYVVLCAGDVWGTRRLATVPDTAKPGNHKKSHGGNRPWWQPPTRVVP